MSNTDIKLTPAELASLKEINPSLYARIQDKQHKAGQRWGPNTNAPYYREEYGQEILPVLQAMLKDKENDQFIELKSFGGINSHTAYQRVQQAIYYVVDCLDPEGVYASLDKLIRLRRTTQGIYVCWKFNTPVASARNTGTLSSTPAEAKFTVAKDAAKKQADPQLAKAIEQHDPSILPEWRSELEEFLDDGSTMSFEMLGLQLSEEDVQDVRDILEGAIRLSHSITRNSIKIKRV